MPVLGFDDGGGHSRAFRQLRTQSPPPQPQAAAERKVDPQETSKYGVIAGEMIRDDIYRVHSMVEKPKPEDAPSNLAIIGRYILTPPKETSL